MRNLDQLLRQYRQDPESIDLKVLFQKAQQEDRLDDWYQIAPPIDRLMGLQELGILNVEAYSLGGINYESTEARVMRDVLDYMEEHYGEAISGYRVNHLENFDIDRDFFNPSMHTFTPNPWFEFLVNFADSPSVRAVFTKRGNNIINYSFSLRLSAIDIADPLSTQAYNNLMEKG